MTDQKVLSTLQKLLAKARSAEELGNEHEAHAFMAKVHELPEKHKLEMSDLEAQDEPIKLHLVDPERLGLPKKPRRMLWEAQLAAIVARAHYCDIILAKGNTFYLVGRRTDRMVAEYMFGYLVSVANQLADKAYTQHFYKCRDAGDVTLARGFRANFLLGFVYRINERYEEEAQAQRQQYARNNPHALIHLSRETALVKQVMDDLTKQGIAQDTDNHGQAPKSFDAMGMAAGFNAADSVRIRGTALNQAGQAAGKLGAGQKLIGGQ